MTELDALEVAKTASKVRAMIYDVDTKERIAWLQGLPRDTYHHISYFDWVDIRNNFKIAVDLL